MDEDFGHGNLELLHIDNTLEALMDWLDHHVSYRPCPMCLQLPEDYDAFMGPDAHRVSYLVDRTRLVQLLREMVAIPSPPLEEGALAEFLARRMEAMGLAVALQEVEDTAAPGLKTRQPIGRWSGSAEGPAILLVAHMDHYHPAPGWARSPYQAHVDGGWFYGCGVQDGKGALASILTALQALRQAGVAVRGQVVVAAVAGHKRAGLGMRHLLADGLRADWALEVASTDMEIVTAGVGLVPARISVAGRPRSPSALAGVSPAASDPVSQIAQIIQALGPSYAALPANGWLSFQPHAELPGFPRLIMDSVKGDAYPDNRCQLDFNIRTVPGQDAASVRDDLERLLSTLGMSAAGSGAEVHVPAPQAVGVRPFVGANDTKLIRLIRKWHKSLIRQKPAVGPGPCLGEVSDAHWAAQAGIPTILYGPGDVRQFESWPAANERIWVEDMAMTASILALALRDLLG